MVRNLSILLLLLVAFVSCINEKSDGCVQYSVETRLVDADGKTLPDSITNNSVAYLFRNGGLEGTVPVDSSGLYNISFCDCDAVTLAVFGNNNTDGISFNNAKHGGNLSTVALTLKDLSLLQDSLTHSRLFYGSIDFSYANLTRSVNETTCSMHDRLARFRIVLTNIESIYGSGVYNAKVDNLHTAFTYGGTVTADSVSFTPSLTRQSDGTYVSGVVNTMPTVGGKGVIITVTKDNTVLDSIGNDGENKPISLTAGTVSAIVVSLKGTSLSVHVMPWSEYLLQKVSL